jgi:outer membrane protein
MESLCRGALRLLVILGIGSPLRAAELTVCLDNPPATGTVAFALFDSANAFGDLRDPAKVVKFPLDSREVYRIEKVSPGEYALLVYYDENGNGRIDRNFMGIPKEPLGFSNRYRPRGPPSYSRSAFVLAEGESRHFDVELRRPLGPRGRIGVGLGCIARGSPYRGYEGTVYQVIPAITYTGDRLQILGPRIQVGLVGNGKLRLGGTGTYRMGVYEEDESDFLAGMGDRKDTVMVGLALEGNLPGGVGLSLSYEHDAIDEIGGGAARIEFDKSFQSGVFAFSPEVALNWLSPELSNHDFGVPSGRATPERAAYDLNGAFSVEGGIGVFLEAAPDWLVVTSIGVEVFGDEVTDSPIVDGNHVLKGFAAVNYVF